MYIMTQNLQDILLTFILFWKSEYLNFLNKYLKIGQFSIRKETKSK